MIARARVYISGKVQGVFFRASTWEVAKRLGLRGYVRNLPDGRVEAVFEGDEEKVRKAIEWCRRGPPLAIVENVEVKWEEPKKDFDDFVILY
ncbi:MAG TPA: acylphosphatase [Thermofilum sp.]|nr:acylphosphatase [Thermofilum sp.]